MPERGVIEVKPTADDAWVTASGKQVSKYWGKYGLVLVTDYRDFVLIGKDAAGNPIKLETLRLAETEQSFWTQAAHPPPSIRSQEVVNAFSRYLKRRDMSFESIPREEIERALAEYARDKGHPAYVAMEQRIQELKEIENRKGEEQRKIEDRRKSKRDKWMDRGISFASGIAITILGVLIKSCLEKK